MYSSFQVKLLNLTTTAVDQLYKSCKSRRLKPSSSVVSFKHAGAGLLAGEIKALSSNFSNSSEMASAIKQVIDNRLITEDAVYDSCTGDMVEDRRFYLR